MIFLHSENFLPLEFFVILLFLESLNAPLKFMYYVFWRNLRELIFVRKFSIFYFFFLNFREETYFIYFASIKFSKIDKKGED